MNLTKFPKVINFGGKKNFSEYYLIKDKSQLYNTALYIVKSRFERKYYEYLLKDNNPKNLYKPDFTKEEVDKMYVGCSRTLKFQKEGLLEQLKRYDSDIKLIEQSHFIYREIQECIELSDGEKAYNLLYQLKDVEYHDFIEIPLKQIKEEEKEDNPSYHKDY